MAKKQRWQNDDTAFDNPFAALSSHPQEPAPAPATAASSAPPDDALPKARSARIERAHRGGKTVTVVSFFHTPDASALNAWLKKTRSALGVGGTVENDTVVLQGDLVERLKSAGILSTSHGNGNRRNTAPNSTKGISPVSPSEQTD